MSRMRRTTEQPLSLFSFQDIITSVTGVMILLTLLLSIELIQRVVSSAPQQTKVQITTSTQSIEEMKAEVAALESKLQSSGKLPDNLPSMDSAALKQKRLQLQEANDRLRGEIAELSDRLHEKRQEVSTAETASASEQQRMAEEFARLEKAIDDAKKQLESMDASNRIFFKKEQGGKETWIVEVTASGIQSAKIGVAAKPRQFANVESFDRWLKSLNSASTAFYLIVKPNGEQSFEAIRKSIRSAGFDVGFHVLAADQQVIDPNMGAAAP